jgi:hypothetical protein
MPTITARTFTTAVAALRVGYGAGLLAAPQRLTRCWLGADAARAATAVAARALGAREIAVHVLVLRAARSGAPVRPLLAASIAGDLTDIAATWTGRRGLPPNSPPLTLLVAGASAAITAVALAWTEQ